MEASRSQGQECGSNLFHSWKIPRRGQGSWSRVHGSQEQKLPPLFAIKKRWPHKTTVSFLKKSLRPYRWEWLFAGLACLTWVLHRSEGERIVVFAVLTQWKDVLHLPSARWLCPSTEQPGAKQTQQMPVICGQVDTRSASTCAGSIWQKSSPSAGKGGRSGGRTTEGVWSIYTQTTTLETLLWAWQHSSKPPACVTLIAWTKGVLTTRTHTETFSRKFRILHLIINSEVASSLLRLCGKKK